MSSGDVAAETQLLSWPSDPAGQPGAGPAHLWDERVPPPGRDATLLVVVPIPGTRMSLAIAGYAITTSPESAAPQALAARARGAQPPAARAAAMPAAAMPAAGTHGAGPRRRRRGRSDGLRLDHRQRRAWADGCEIELTFREFELLAFLSAHPATVFTRAELIEQVWHGQPGHDDGRAAAGPSRTVDVHVSRVRRKLGPRHGQGLVTEYRVGYQYRPVGS